MVEMPNEIVACGGWLCIDSMSKPGTSCFCSLLVLSYVCVCIYLHAASSSKAQSSLHKVFIKIINKLA